jgi:hypothetical protein
MVTGLFRDRDSAERAYQAATELGYPGSDINLLMTEETRERYFSSQQRNTGLSNQARHEAEEPAEAADDLGGPVGGTMGTLAPVLAALGTLLLVPGIVIAGPAAIALTAAGAVGVAGGLVGALTNWGIPKGRVEKYQADIRDGGILIGIKPRNEDDARRLKERWEKGGGVLIQ